MSESIGAMADEILGGALSNPTKNPYDPNAEKPLMDPNDRLVEMSDAQREFLMEGVGIQRTPVVAEETKAFVITEGDLEILGKAKEIIEKIQEATTVGNLGVNLAGPQKNPKKVKMRAGKRAKKEKVVTNDFLSYLNPR